jgi:hypothetical protein
MNEKSGAKIEIFLSWYEFLLTYTCVRILQLALFFRVILNFDYFSRLSILTDNSRLKIANVQ